MPGWMREGINPSPTLDPMNIMFGYFRTKSGSNRELVPGAGFAGWRPRMISMTCLILAGSFFPGLDSTPELKSRALGETDRIASATLSAPNPPANTRGCLSPASRASLQSARSPVPP